MILAPHSSAQPWRTRLAGGLACVGILILTACGSGGSAASDGGSAALPSTSGEAASSQPSTSVSGTPSALPQAPEVTVTPAFGTTLVNPVDPVTVSTDRGELVAVSVISDGGVEAVGKLSPDGTTWTSTESLEFDAFYTVTYTADNAGRTVESTSTFSTVDPAHQMDVNLNVAEGESYGVWQVVEFDFSAPVAHKEQIEKAITVNGGGDHAGAFRWYSDMKLRYRPEKPWGAHSRVTVAVDLFGKDVGDGMVGNANKTVSFTTGAEHRAYVDNEKKTLVAYVDGQKTGEWPVTLGNPEWPSTTGKKVIIEQAPSYEFKPDSLDLKPGDPHYYEPFDASNVSRLTWSGEFIHQALPSAIPILGQVNVSHGCVGMPADGAKYILDAFRPGDMVEVVNTGYPQADPDDGYGDWNIPFKNYADETWKGNW